MKREGACLHSLKYVRTLQCTHIDFSTPPGRLGRAATVVVSVMCCNNWLCDTGLVCGLLPTGTISSLAVAVLVVVASVLAFTRNLVHDRGTVLALGLLPHLTVRSVTHGGRCFPVSTIGVGVDDLAVRAGVLLSSCKSSSS